MNRKAWFYIQWILTKIKKNRKIVWSWQRAVRGGGVKIRKGESLPLAPARKRSFATPSAGTPRNAPNGF